MIIFNGRFMAVRLERGCYGNEMLTYVYCCKRMITELYKTRIMGVRVARDDRLQGAGYGLASTPAMKAY